MSIEQLFGYFFAALCVGAAIYVAVGRNLLKTMIAFFVEVASVGGVLLSLDADYLALAVLAVALLGTIIVTAFSSTIMGSLKGTFEAEKAGKKNTLGLVFGMSLGLLCGGAIGWAFLSDAFLANIKVAEGMGPAPAVPANVTNVMDVHTLGTMMLGEQLLTFQLLAVLVLVLVIGSGLLLRRNTDAH